MKRSALLWVALACASCATDTSGNPQPDSLAMADPSSVVSQTESTDTMVFEIAGERLELDAGICNTYDNGTFRFALAEGPLEQAGRVTATIERFAAGVDQDIVIVIEGTRDDGTALRWYARSSLSDHDVTIALFASTLEGSAVFSSDNDEQAEGVRASGTFAIRCSDGVPEPTRP